MFSIDFHKDYKTFPETADVLYRHVRRMLLEKLITAWYTKIDFLGP